MDAIRQLSVLHYHCRQVRTHVCTPVIPKIRTCVAVTQPVFIMNGRSAEFEGKSSGHRYTHTEETQTPNQQGVTTIYRECNHITSKPTRSYNQIQGTQPYNLQKQDYSHIHVITHSSRGELRTLELETLYMRIRTNPRLSSTHIQPYDSPLQEYRDINKHVEIYVETKLRPSPSSHPLNQNY